MPLKPRRIALFGNFGSDNLGNEASLKAMLDLLRRERPDAELACICYGVENARSAHGITAIPITPPFPQSRGFKTLNRWLLKFPFQFHDFLHALRNVRKFDVLIAPGTGILDDFSERWQGMPYDLFKWSVAATLMRRRFAFVSVGAGPIRHGLSRWLMKSAARMADYRSFRDEPSKEYMVEHGGAKESDPIFPDLVFALPAPDRLSKKAATDRITTIGVGVMHYYGWDRQSPARPQIHETYLSSISQFIAWLVEHGYRVRLLIGAQSDQRSFPDILARVAAKCGASAAQAIIVEAADSFDDLMRQIADTDLVVTTRFHNIVADLKLARPVISLGYGQKNDVLLEKFGLGAYCQPVEHIDVPALISQLETLVEIRETFAERFSEATRFILHCLEEQNTFLLASVL